jgi:hypothetical protein
MTEELDDQSKRRLAQARRGLSPNREDQERVRALLMARLNASTADAPAVAGLARKLASWIALAALFGTGGFIAGYGAASRNAAQLGSVEHRPVSARAEAPTPLEPKITAARGVLAESNAAPAVARGVAEPVALPKRARPRAGDAAVSDNVTPVASNPSLELELAAVRRMDLALREGKPSLALSILDQLDREVPEGALLEERLAGFVMARCEVGLGSRAALLSEFERQHAGSMYLERVRKHCARKVR